LVPELPLPNTVLSLTLNIEAAMPKPDITSAAGLATAADSAVRESGERDEDNLDIEGPGKGGDIAGLVVTHLVRNLFDSGPAGVFLLRKFITSLTEVADGVMAKDHAAVEEAGDSATQALGQLLEQEE
jgi:hypothetical protein